MYHHLPFSISARLQYGTCASSRSPCQFLLFRWRKQPLPRNPCGFNRIFPLPIPFLAVLIPNLSLVSNTNTIFLSSTHFGIPRIGGKSGGGRWIIWASAPRGRELGICKPTGKGWGCWSPVTAKAERQTATTFPTAHALTIHFDAHEISVMGLDLRPSISVLCLFSHAAYFESPHDP
jgi:hypothetical protein